MLTPLSPEDVLDFEGQATHAHAFAKENGTLLVGGWGVGADMANWLCGSQSLIVMTCEQPEFVTELLELIHQWNMRRMQVVLRAKIDLFIRRAWYEGCDFLRPQFYREAILPGLKAEVALSTITAHCSVTSYLSGTLPMLDFYKEAGIDVLIGVDPVPGHVHRHGSYEAEACGTDLPVGWPLGRSHRRNGLGGGSEIRGACRRRNASTPGFHPLARRQPHRGRTSHLGQRESSD